jgi:hypothetical protein
MTILTPSPPVEQDFKSAATGVSAKAMRNELNSMIQSIDDAEYKKVRLRLPLPPSLSARREREQY